MSGQNGSPEDRTEAPTARRLQRSREEGEVPVSREAVLLGGMTAFTLAFLLLDDRIGRALVHPLAIILARPGLPLSEPFAISHELALAFAVAVGPLAGAIASGAIATTLAQTRFALRASGLRADFGRLSPAAGLKRMFGPESLVETGKSLARLAIIGGGVALVLRQELSRIETLAAAPLTLLPGFLTSVVIRLLLVTLLGQAVIAAADIAWIWRRHLRQLRMSRSDVKDETKETEGDPAVKLRIRRLRMRRARQRMLAAVPSATVVVTNPTHYAVALTYDVNRSSVPLVVAKGVDSLAARIREAARENGVPVVANPPLARALHQVPLGGKVPPELYKLVAELIAYVWRLNGRRPV